MKKKPIELKYSHTSVAYVETPDNDSCLEFIQVFQVGTKIIVTSCNGFWSKTYQGRAPISKNIYMAENGLDLESFHERVIDAKPLLKKFAREWKKRKPILKLPSSGEVNELAYLGVIDAIAPFFPEDITWHLIREHPGTWVITNLEGLSATISSDLECIDHTPLSDEAELLFKKIKAEILSRMVLE